MIRPQPPAERCQTMATLQRILGGDWKLEILYYIAVDDMHRFGQLRQRLGDIPEQSLTKQLRDLEADGLLLRRDYRSVPPRVEYTLTDLGKSFVEVLRHMKEWGDNHLPREAEGPPADGARQ